ncbi:hypothetical protein [Xanthobacter autotrophicus]|uniref:hypothetical protein n=1 Tax=Xanthobacter autotrophicus TaxID=280 RepID=UPI00372D6439
MITTPACSPTPPRRWTGTLAAAMLVLTCDAALAQDAAKPQHVPLQKTIGVPHAGRPIPSLAVINAAGAKLEGNKLTLTGVSANTIVFADRPVRAAGHETIQQFLMQWDEGKDSFAIDPPNATVSVLGAKPGEVSDVVVTLKTPKLDGSTLTFDVAVLEGTLTPGGPVALFIDAWAVRGPDGGGAVHVGGYGAYHGGAYYHAPVYHGAWYAHPAYPAGAAVAGAAVGVAAGAAIGAAAAAPPPPPAYYCGYYPYPPCY